MALHLYSRAKVKFTVHLQKWFADLLLAWYMQYLFIGVLIYNTYIRKYIFQALGDFAVYYRYSHIKIDKLLLLPEEKKKRDT